MVSQGIIYKEVAGREGTGKLNKKSPKKATFDNSNLSKKDKKSYHLATE